MQDFDAEAAAKAFSDFGVSFQKAADSMASFSRRLVEIDYGSIEQRVMALHFRDRPSLDAAVFRAFAMVRPLPEAARPSMAFLYGRSPKQDDLFTLRPLDEAMPRSERPDPYPALTEDS